MEKEDVVSLVAAIVIVIIVAVVVKPMVNGEDPGQGTPGVTGPGNGSVVPTPSVTDPPLPTPTPAPGWDGKPQEIGFVDPSSYNLSLVKERVQAPIRYPALPQSTNKMVTYAEIHGTESGTTEIVHIPYPYWELWYEADPYNTEFCFFNIQVMDANDPNRFVRILSHPHADFKQGNTTKSDSETDGMWSEKFFEGYRDYWFVINTYCIKSYDLKVMVPERYVEQQSE
ncbi:hypothetical protein J2129_000628 [Methanofollis sp. W23]|nr:hypothetical protein [Methanofollis sp. W23]